MVKRGNTSNMPSEVTLYEAVFKALQELDGSGKNDEIRNRIIDDLKLPDEVVDMDHDGTVTELEYRLKWTRTDLKNAGIIERSQRGVWAITPAYAKAATINGSAVRKERSGRKSENIPSEVTDGKSVSSTGNDISEESVDQPWHQQLVKILAEMNPIGFERLTTRLLRECGFSDVKVTQQTADHGIDGIGRIQLYGLVSFNVAFQCKRQKQPVSSSQIREFRGSLNAVYEKGIFITTGTFSNAAQKEANDSSKSPEIDLIDGEEFIQLLINHQLGVEEIKDYKVNKNFFDEI